MVTAEGLPKQITSVISDIRLALKSAKREVPNELFPILQDIGEIIDQIQTDCMRTPGISPSGHSSGKESQYLDEQFEAQKAVKGTGTEQIAKTDSMGVFDRQQLFQLKQRVSSEAVRRILAGIDQLMELQQQCGQSREIQIQLERALSRISELIPDIR